MSLFSNNKTTTGGGLNLTSNTAGGSNTTGGGLTGGLTGGMTGGMTGGGLGLSGSGGNTYSITAPNISPQHENEFNAILDEVGGTLNLQNPVTCKFKHPIYQTVQVHGVPPAEASQYKFVFDSALWEEYQKNLPSQSGKFQYYIGFIMGMDALEKRVKETVNYFELLNKTENELRIKQDGILKEYDTKLKEDINRIKRKNFILLDKLLTVHALLEKVALQYNECNRKPNEEMRLYNKYVTLEAVPNEIQTRLLDIRLNRENAKVANPKNTLSHVTDQESKRNVLDLLSKMKKGVEILNKMHQDDARDVEQMLRYAENKGKIY